MPATETSRVRIPALVLAEGAFRTAEGKTAHGLVRYSDLYRILGIIDSTCAGEDAGVLLDGESVGIPIFARIEDALAAVPEPPRRLIVGVATDGGRIPRAYFPILKTAIRHGLSIMSGLHEELTQQKDLVALARRHGVLLEDVRKPLPKEESHFFTGKIAEVQCPRIAVLGTDSAIGKRTTARVLVQALRARGYNAVFIGTGQTGRMQGARYSIILDSIINDFVTGEIEHAVHSAWVNERPDVIVIEGQGALTHPAYPGGFEIIAGARVDGIVLQHAPGRVTLDGFPQYPMPDLHREIALLELLAQKPVFAITLNHENLTREETREWAARLTAAHDRPVTDVLLEGPDALVAATVERFALEKRQPE